MKQILNMLCALALLTFAANASAHTLVGFKKAKNSALQSAINTAGNLAEKMSAAYSGGGGTVLSTYAITEFSPKRKKKEKLADLYIRVARYVLHRDYPITGDDGGYNFTQLKSSANVLDDLPDTFRGQSNDDNINKAAAKFVADLKDAIDDGLLVFSGNGSGYNSYVTIVVVADPKNKQFFYLLDSNFSSDD